VSDWIKVKDRLPEFNEECSVPVLMFFSTHIESGVFYKDENDKPYHVFFDGETLCYEPTHWMPFPEMPEGV